MRVIIEIPEEIADLVLEAVGRDVEPIMGETRNERAARALKNWGNTRTLQYVREPIYNAARVEAQQAADAAIAQLQEEQNQVTIRFE